MRRSACQHLLRSLESVYLPGTLNPPSFTTSLRSQLRHRSSCYSRARHKVYNNTRRPRVDTAHSRQPEYQILQSSHSSYILLFAFLGAGAYLVSYIYREEPQLPTSSSPKSSSSAPTTSYDPFFTNMPIPPGHRGNLSPEQETKLRDLWAKVLHTFGVEDVTHTNGTATPHDDTPSVSEAEAAQKKRKKSRLSIFGSKKEDTSTGKSIDDSDDKYGQVKEFQQIIANQTPESLRTTFWTMIKADQPDTLLLRFLRARKWDVDKALVMLISTISWRSREMHVDDDLILNGEAGALADSKSSDASVKKEGHDFLEQLRLGKSFLHGTDKEGRPLCIVRARLHHGGDQTEKALEKYTVHVIETGRLLLKAPVETSTIVFDMTHFTMANMDYAPVKFMIKVFEANYPESLGSVLVHKAPWIFQGIWKIIKGWLDPVVAAKIHFTSDLKDLEEYVPRHQIIKELGGDEDWEYTYVEPQEGENEPMKDEATRDKLLSERSADVLEYQKQTFEMINSGGSAESKSKRDAIAIRLHDNYWQLDPHVRARTLYDRIGMIEKSGKINFYPSHEKAKQEVASTATAPAVVAPTNGDDVD